MNATLGTGEMLLCIAGLAAISMLTRSFFFISRSDWRVPAWLERGLRYAPLAALAAVVAPDIVLSEGQWTGHWQDPRWPAAVLAMAWAVWRRDLLGTIVVGMATLTFCRVALGWSL
jgi:branched-subunit amino acid transport protein